MKRYSYFRLRDTMVETLEKIKNADLDAISDERNTLDAFKGVYEVYKILDNHYFYGDGCGASSYELEYDSKDENNALFLRFQRTLDRARRKNKPEAYQLGILIAARYLYDVIRENTDKNILPDVAIAFRMRMSIDSPDDEIITKHRCAEHDAMSPMRPSSNPSVKAVFIQNKIAKTKYDDIFKPVYAQLADMAAYAVTKPAVATVLVMDVEALMGYVDDIRHHYNELEAKYQKQCGMISEYEEENKNLKDMMEKDGEFGKNVGKRVADSIREGCDKGVYELHPHTRIDIHVEETNNMPMTFDRHAIPRIAVMFNNAQTEMERDTAQHECEELDRKFKELVKENEELRMTLAMFERDANMARELCHNIAFNAERARSKTPWFND